MVMRILFFVCLLLPCLVKAQTKKPAANASTSSANTSLKNSITRGQAVYQQLCLACHQADGSGVPNLNPPLMRNPWTMGPKDVLITQVLNGSNGKVEIDGDRFNNTMPPLGTVLTDQQIADVLTYVRNNFGNDGSAVTTAEVKAVRAKTK
jgi:mono/diheme cytochrome c family protein